jgi:hypothetical protein
MLFGDVGVAGWGEWMSLWYDMLRYCDWCCRGELGVESVFSFVSQRGAWCE